eukprot:Amastigsp_a842558_127.p2 type:complete len:176 gc:universal Amastigsp_a842558_127:65-592(+)
MRAFFRIAGSASCSSSRRHSKTLSSIHGGEPSQRSCIACARTPASTSFTAISAIRAQNSGTSFRTWHGQSSFTAALRAIGSATNVAARSSAEVTVSGSVLPAFLRSSALSASKVPQLPSRAYFDFDAQVAGAAVGSTKHTAAASGGGASRLALFAIPTPSASQTRVANISAVAAS